MTTGAERRALVFAAAIAALGVVARVVRAREERPTPAPAAVRALDAQIARVDSARRASRSTTPRKAPAGPGPVGRKAPGPVAPQPILVDVDVADAAAIERLPWIGPALAARIVENRERCGPFGALEALTRVTGIGEGTTRRLAPYVTFSGRPSPTGAAGVRKCPGAAPGAASRRRGRS